MSLPPSVWTVRGSKPGPVTAVIGGTHGDEPVGTVIVDRLRSAFGLVGETFECASDAVCGTLYLLHGNPEALKRKTRAAEGRRDLNRWFLPEDLDRAPAPSDPADLRRAREIAPVLASASVVLDVHSTSSDAPPFLCCVDPAPRHQELARAFDVPYFLCDPRRLLARDLGLSDPGTTDRWVGRHGGCGICYETGRQDDFARTEAAWDGTRRFLSLVGTMDAESVGRLLGAPPADPSRAPRFCALEEEITAVEDGFSYAPGRDVGWTPIGSGDLIGTYPSGTAVRASVSGLLVFPKAARLVKRGDNLCYVASPLGRSDA